ncbi:MAG TPA: hypothetical protein VGP97_24640 [Burkholderiales bacterium]|jgi:hypothetical protein|nr:hypothetical protein [Burkholderiales bacterium]
MPSWSPPLRALPAVVLVLSLTGCAAFRNYDQELTGTLNYALSGNVDGAIKTLDSNNPVNDRDLLYYLELGMLQRLGNRYPESQKTWTAANTRIQLRDPLAEAASLVRSGSSYLLSDKLRTYDGYDYEKAMLLTYMAMNYLALGDYDNARVAIKQTHELEAVLAEQRAKQIAEVAEEAKKKGARTSFKELNGYPVQSIDNPEVNALINSYQSALSHYLAGFIYEALGEVSLAAPGYRLANELHPGVPLLEDALAGLEARLHAPDDGKVDVLFIVASGTAPALHSQQFNLPVLSGYRWVLVPISFPVITPSAWSPRPSALAVEGAATMPLAPITSVDLMARRRLKDDMPSIMLRSSVRAAASAVAQVQTQRAADRGNNAAGLAALVVTLGSVLMSSADDRTWRTLPSDISIARARLPAGVHSVTIQTPQGPRTARVDVKGRHAVIDFWLLGNQLYGYHPGTQEGSSR